MESKEEGDDCIKEFSLFQILCLKFAKNGIKNNNNDLFPENDKTHKMKTRVVENYKAQHANTERFKKSSIIAMQKMLNHDTRT